MLGLYRVFFLSAVDLKQRLAAFRCYYNEHRVRRSLDATPAAQPAGTPSPAPAALDHYGWRQHCRGLFQIPVAS